MSRATKFRFFSKETDRYVDASDYCVTGNGDIYCISDLRGYQESHELSHVIDKEQFTGLTDKNGVEIYEGDIVNSDFEGEHCPSFIGFENGAFVLNYPEWYVALRKPYITEFEINEMNYIVIGNIHQNPELIGK